MDDIGSYVDAITLKQMIKDSTYCMNTAMISKSVPDVIMFGNEVNTLVTIKNRYIEMLKSNPELMQNKRGEKNEQHIEY